MGRAQYCTSSLILCALGRRGALGAADAPESTTKVSRPSKKRAQWQERINEGRELTLEDVEGASPIGVKALVLYLRAMDVKVTRDVQVDAQALRQLARQSLLLLQGRRWSKASRTKVVLNNTNYVVL